MKGKAGNPGKIYGNIPFSPSRLPFFYGWAVLVAGAVGVVMSIPGQTMGVSVFTDRLIESLNISRLNLSLAYMIGTLGSSMILSAAGRQYDRFGARITAFAASVFMGLVLLYMSSLETISRVVSGLTGIPFTLVSFLLIIPGFFALRFFGQGVLTMVSRNMVMKWFNRKRGLAAALMGVITSFGFAYAPKPFNSLIILYGWEGAWRIIGITALFIFPCFILFFYRDNPEICGLKPDGGSGLSAEQGDSGSEKVSEEFSYTLKEARKTAVFWISIFTVAFWALYNTAITFHIVSIFAIKGMASTIAVSIFLPYSVVSIASRFISGWISDRCRIKYIMLLHLLSSVAALLFLLALSKSPVTIWGFIIFLGIASGSWGVLNSITWIRLFGRKHLGEITGFAMGWIVAGSAVGPYLFSISEKITESYGTAVLFCVFSIVVIIFLTIFKVEK